MTQTVDFDALPRQLNQLFESLSTFEQLLESEATALKDSQQTNLVEILKEKETLSSEVSECFDQLSHNLSPASPSGKDPLSLNEFMLSDTFKSLPLSVQTQFQKTSEQAILCSEKNLANGMTVQALSHMNATLLQLMKGQDPQSRTYTATGESNTGNPSTKPLGKA